MADTQNQPLFGQPAVSPEQLKYRRALAAELMKQGMSAEPIRSPWQGVGRIVQSLVGGYESSLEDKAEAAARKDALAQVLSGKAAAENKGDVKPYLGTLLTNPWLPERLAGEGLGTTAPRSATVTAGDVNAPFYQPPPASFAQPPQQPNLPPARTPQASAPIPPPGPATFNQRFGFDPAKPVQTVQAPQSMLPPSVQPLVEEASAMGRTVQAKKTQQAAQLDALNEDIAAAKAAPAQLTNLAAIGQIVANSPPMTGPAGQALLQLRQLVNGAFGRDIIGESAPSEVMLKLNRGLAAEAAKGLRGSNLDLTTMLEAQPGNLMMSPKGTGVLTNIIGQIRQREAKLGNFAASTRSYDTYLNDREKFFSAPENAIMNPLTGRPLTAADTKVGGAGRFTWSKDKGLVPQ